jgi:5-methylcytosine-specific restriction endonuclease McrA
MKRSPLLRRTPLARKRRSGVVSMAERVWKMPEHGFCQCGCGRFSARLHRHHVLLRQTVRREGADQWSLRNAMLLHPDCHAAHHAGQRKILLAQVPESALAFAVDVLGEAGAADYFRRRYAP